MMVLSQHKRYLRAMTHWVLILALLLGQSLALGHDHDADQDPEGICALCLLVQQSDSVIPSDTDGLPVQVFHVGITRSASQQFAAVIALPFHSRAPPFISR